jgi:hypothetical protein
MTAEASSHAWLLDRSSDRIAASCCGRDRRIAPNNILEGALGMGEREQITHRRPVASEDGSRLNSLVPGIAMACTAGRRLADNFTVAKVIGVVIIRRSRANAPLRERPRLV